MAEKVQVAERTSCYARLSLRQKLLIDRAVAERQRRMASPQRNAEELREAFAAHIDFFEDAARHYDRTAESIQHTLH